MDNPKNIGSQIVDHLFEVNEHPNTKLNDWMNTSGENNTLVEKLSKIWKGTEKLASAKQFDSAVGWSVVDRINKRNMIRKRRLQNAMYSVLGMAASLLIILGLTFYTNLMSVTQDQMELSTNYGSRSEVVLPDGSKVTLNSGSNLSYSYNKLSRTREVVFYGEGFFNVAKSKKPFIVKTDNGMKLKVLGTQFNVSAYPEDEAVQITLVEGKVELSNNKGEKLLLAPGQIAQFDNSTRNLKLREGNPFHMYGWVNNKFYLDNTSLKETSVTLERMFDVRINFSPVNLGEEIHYTGVLEEQTIFDVLNALSDLSEIKYTYHGKEIIISKK